MLSNNPLDRSTKKDLLADPIREQIATSKHFSAMYPMDLVNAMYQRGGQEKLDHIVSGQKKLIYLSYANIRQIFSMRVKKTDALIHMLVNDSPLEDTLADLDALWIRYSPLLYQYLCKQLRISSFSDILTSADIYAVHRYYVKQGGLSTLSSLKEVIQNALVRTVLRYSILLNILHIPHDEFDIPIDIDDLLGSSQSISTDIETADELIKELQDVTNLEKTHQTLFFCQQTFVDADMQQKISLLCEQLQCAGDRVFEIVACNIETFMHYRGRLQLPLYVTRKNIKYHKAVANDTQAVQYFDLLLHDSDKGVMYTDDVMQYLCACLLMEVVRCYFYKGTNANALMTVALENFTKFAQSKDIQLVVTF